jgi:hypothetical protein
MDGVERVREGKERKEKKRREKERGVVSFCFSSPFFSWPVVKTQKKKKKLFTCSVFIE